MTSAPILAAVFGCAGPELRPEEAAFFRASNPLGFILFARNCDNPEQIRRLTAALRAAVGRTAAPVLMDHEGGRVQRLPTPQWRKIPPAAIFGGLARHDKSLAQDAVTLNARLMALELADLGIDVDCVPCLDVHDPSSHQVIGDRAFSADPELVAQLGRAQADGLRRGGILPVIKHIPGHGRTQVDSHLEMPVVASDWNALASRDFRPFAALADLPLAMTGHLLFPALDPDHPATMSKIIIDEIIRKHIGFDGLLFTDDLSMQALSGDLGQRTADALAAGCDVALHCNGKGEEMRAVAEACQPLSGQSQRRWQRALAWRRPPEPAIYDDLLARLNDLLGSR
ncbi:MAG: beta-N-acetylhexosaminidase [Proteobacteria bacterium]|nr:beta-N-acetylhexosaminidase [Pseudomonadota bacterium]